MLFMFLCATSANAQITTEQLKPFIGELKLVSSLGPGLDDASGDILLLLEDAEYNDFLTLVLVRNTKGKLKLIVQNDGLLMAQSMLGNSGDNVPYLGADLLFADYNMGSNSSYSSVSMVFKKDKKGDYYFHEYHSRTSHYGEEDPNERVYITATQIGRLAFKDATEEGILEKAKSKPQEKAFYLEPERAVISGTIQRKSVYGAPNYGETPEKDENLSILVLQTEKPISIYPSEMFPDPEFTESTEIGIIEIQIYSANHDLNLETLLNKKVSLEGVLQTARAAHQFTPIVMEVAKIME